MTAAGFNSKKASQLVAEVANCLVDHKKTPPADERKAARERLEQAKIAYELSGETDLALKGSYQELLAQKQRAHSGTTAASIASLVSKRKKPLA
jgi:hypothetical protein